MTVVEREVVNEDNEQIRLKAQSQSAFFEDAAKRICAWMIPHYSPEAIAASSRYFGEALHIYLEIEPKKRGFIIGREGRTIEAVRNIMQSIGMAHGKVKVRTHIKEDGDGR